ncbi:MAG: DUF4390 domain-containing protein [Longimicrobiales bacterium]
MSLPVAAGAQGAAPLYLRPQPGTGALEMRLGNVFEDEALVRALHSGLPLRVQVRAELWKDGFFDSQRGRGEWRASVVYDPLERRYRVATGGEGATELSVDSLSAARDALQAAFAVPLRPFEEGRYYYLGQVEIETLSLSDLDELQRWLRGDLATSAGGEGEMGTAVERGFHRVVVRVLGIPVRRYRVRTQPFAYGALDPG